MNSLVWGREKGGVVGSSLAFMVRIVTPRMMKNHSCRSGFSRDTASPPRHRPFAAKAAPTGKLAYFPLKFSPLLPSMHL